jgi:L-aminopeptidase/D-esterase-like protein
MTGPAIDTALEGNGAGRGATAASIPAGAGGSPRGHPANTRTMMHAALRIWRDHNTLNYWAFRYVL